MTSLVLTQEERQQRRIPDWLEPYKNEWRSMSAMGGLFCITGRPMSSWLQEIRPRLRCVRKPLRGNQGIGSYYLVKQIWACSLAHGIQLLPSPALDREKIDRIAELESQLESARVKLFYLQNRTPEVRIVADPNRPALLAAMLSATEPRPLPGVYFLISEGVVTYVGQSQNVLARMSGHTGKTFDTVKMIHIPDPTARLAEEGRWINAFAPRDNIKGLEARRMAA